MMWVAVGCLVMHWIPQVTLSTLLDDAGDKLLSG